MFYVYEKLLRSFLVTALLFSCLVSTSFIFQKNVSTDYPAYNWDEGDEKSADQSYRISSFLNDLKEMIGKEFDDIYAGSWGDFENDPHVGLLRIDDKTQILADKYGVILIKQKYSYKELVELQEYIVENNDTKYKSSHSSSAIMEEVNRLELTLYDVEELRLTNPEIIEELENDPRILLYSIDSANEEGGFAAN